MMKLRTFEGYTCKFWVAGDAIICLSNGGYGFNVFDFNTGALRYAVENPFPNSVWCLDVAVDNSRFKVNSKNSSVIFDLQTGLILTDNTLSYKNLDIRNTSVENWTFEFDLPVIDISTDSTFFAVGYYNGIVRLYDLKTKCCVKTLNPYNGSILLSIMKVKISPCGKYLATATYGGEVKIWAVNSARVLVEYNHTTRTSIQLQFTDDSTTLVSACERIMLICTEFDSNSPLRLYSLDVNNHDLRE